MEIIRETMDRAGIQQVMHIEMLELRVELPYLIAKNAQDIYQYFSPLTIQIFLVDQYQWNTTNYPSLQVSSIDNAHTIYI